MTKEKTMLRSRVTKREEIADEDPTQGSQHGERPDEDPTAKG
jgi:hypothetical protein